MSTSAKGKKSLADEAVEKYSNKAQEQTESESESKEQSVAQKFESIKENPFHQIVMQSDASPNEKQKSVAQELAFDATESKEENQAKLEAFSEFKDYLMAYRKEMSKEIIRLHDTEAFGELQKVFEEMNTALLEFEDQIEPLVEMIAAVNKLNMASDGKMFDVFREIQEDKEQEQQRIEQRKVYDEKLEQLHSSTNQYKVNIASLSQDKGWFGLGGIKSDSQRKIGENQVKLEQAGADLNSLIVEIEEFEADGDKRTSKFAELASEKEKLRELLGSDIG